MGPTHTNTMCHLPYYYISTLQGHTQLETAAHWDVLLHNVRRKAFVTLIEGYRPSVEGLEQMSAS